MDSSAQNTVELEHGGIRRASGATRRRTRTRGCPPASCQARPAGAFRRDPAAPGPPRARQPQSPGLPVLSSTNFRYQKMTTRSMSE